MNKALVLLSGGQDSATCLLWAIQKYEKVEAISFDYQQTHYRELESSERICNLLKVNRKVIDVSFIHSISVSSLLQKPTQPSKSAHPLNPSLPASFLPGRNILFLTIAGMYAYTLGIDVLIGGMCQTDYSGYPDCRLQFILDMNLAISQGLDKAMYIETPLMHLTKAESIKLALSLPKGKEVLALTHTCYKGEYPPCGECPACLIRAKGFQEVGIKDPLLEE